MCYSGREAQWLGWQYRQLSSPIMTSSLILHGTALSGHTHRVELFLNLLQLPYRRIDAPAPVRRSAEFLGLNPLGQIPVLQDGELALTDSNAILVYLAKRYAPGGAWLPEVPVGAAAVPGAGGMPARGRARPRRASRRPPSGSPPPARCPRRRIPR